MARVLEVLHCHPDLVPMNRPAKNRFSANWKAKDAQGVFLPIFILSIKTIR
jgi:hypothetical protein